GLAYIASTGAFDGQGEVYTGAITRGEVAKLIAYGLNLSESTETDFTDIEDSQYKPYIEIVNAYGYMQGNGDGTFKPDAIMTRAEFCSVFNQIIDRQDALLVSKDGRQVTPETYYFTDLHEGEWYTPVMLRATSAYDEDGYVDIDTRLSNIRNVLDNYDSQKMF
ncbi:MAG: S-layer homology domain-containing protein, partial [Clostridia bacterium]|nr:S-layer homology domain-containing protein [Clostridia bacterium]